LVNCNGGRKSHHKIEVKLPSLRYVATWVTSEAALQKIGGRNLRLGTILGKRERGLGRLERKPHEVIRRESQGGGFSCL